MMELLRPEVYKMGSIIVPPHKPESFKYLPISGLFVSAVTNVTFTETINAALDEYCFKFVATGAPVVTIELAVQLPADFKKFPGASDDLTISAIQDADSGDGVGDMAITVDVLDDAGADADDDTIDDIALTNAFVALDCAITGGTFAKGDWITIKIGVTSKGGDASEAGDEASVSLPKIKYIPK